jgi:hypothetical protein
MLREIAIFTLPPSATVPSSAAWAATSFSSVVACPIDAHDTSAPCGAQKSSPS